MSLRNTAAKNELPFEDSHEPNLKVRRGLCSTCKHASECTFPVDPQRPVLQCEEFEGVENNVTIKNKPEIELVRKEDLNKDADTQEFKGLCKLCRLRNSCTFPKPEGGVWHCEEYE